MLGKKVKFFVLLIVGAMVFSGIAIAVSDMAHPSSGVINVMSDSMQHVATPLQYPNGNDPNGIVYDPYNQEIYITNSLSNNVTAVNAFTGISVANISVGDNPQGICIAE